MINPIVDLIGLPHQMSFTPMIPESKTAVGMRMRYKAAKVVIIESSVAAVPRRNPAQLKMIEKRVKRRDSDHVFPTDLNYRRIAGKRRHDLMSEMNNQQRSVNAVDGREK